MPSNKVCRTETSSGKPKESFGVVEDEDSIGLSQQVNQIIVREAGPLSSKNTWGYYLNALTRKLEHAGNYTGEQVDKR